MNQVLRRARLLTLISSAIVIGSSMCRPRVAAVAEEVSPRPNLGSRDVRRNLSPGVREMWNHTIACEQSGPALAGRYITATDWAVDSKGNTIVGGQRTCFALGVQNQAFITKLNALGGETWEYEFDTNCFNGVESLAVDRRGNIAFSASFLPRDEKPPVVVKLSSDGQALWSHPIDRAFTMWNVPTSTIRLDRTGNVYLLALLHQGPNGAETELQLSKYSSLGGLLWSRTLPGTGYGLLENIGLRGCLSVLADGSAVIAGMQSFRAFAAKLDSRGRPVWFVHPTPNDWEPLLYTSLRSARVGRFGSVCVSGGSSLFCVLSSGGALLISGSAPFGCSGDVHAATRDGGFLIGCGDTLTALDRNGQTTWRTLTKFLRFGGVVPMDGGGWLAAGDDGGWPSRTTLKCLDDSGNEVWSAELPYTFAPGGLRQCFLKVEDGTFRLVAQLPSSLISNQPSERIEVLALQLIYGTSPRTGHGDGPFQAVRSRAVVGPDQ